LRTGTAIGFCASREHYLKFLVQVTAPLIARARTGENGRPVSEHVIVAVAAVAVTPRDAVGQ